ncbi:MAG: hypothetical protein ABUL62_28225 [Myxococcales bacterium]
MDNNKTQQTWTQATESFFCAKCKACRLQIWNKVKGADAPQHATVIGEAWVAVHCDYFRRRMDNPEHMVQCGAFQKRTDKHEPRRDDVAAVAAGTSDAE